MRHIQADFWLLLIRSRLKIDQVVDPLARMETELDDDGLDSLLGQHHDVHPVHGQVEDESAEQGHRHAHGPDGEDLHEHGKARVAARAQGADEEHEVVDAQPQAEREGQHQHAQVVGGGRRNVVQAQANEGLAD